MLFRTRAEVPMADHFGYVLTLFSLIVIISRIWSTQDIWVSPKHLPKVVAFGMRRVFLFCLRVGRCGLKGVPEPEIKDQLDCRRLAHFNCGVRLLWNLSLVLILVQMVAFWFVSADRRPNLRTTMVMTLTIHFIFWPFACKLVTPRKQHMKYIYVLIHLLMCCALLKMDPSAPMATMGSGGRLCVRIIMGLALLDFNTAFLWNLLYSTLECWKFCASLRHFDNSILAALLSSFGFEIYSFCGTIIILFFVETATEAFIRAAHVQQFGFRKILSVLCDAEVLLTCDSKVIKPSLQLSDLLSLCPNTFALEGHDFIEFILDSDRQRFLDFITKASCKQAFDSVKVDDAQLFGNVKHWLGPPASIQINLFKNGAPLPVELFHANCLQPNNEIGHLISIRVCCASSLIKPEANVLKSEAPDTSEIDESKNDAECGLIALCEKPAIAATPYLLKSGEPDAREIDETKNNAECGLIASCEKPALARTHHFNTAASDVSLPGVTDLKLRRTHSSSGRSKRRSVVAVVRHADRADGANCWDRAWLDSEDYKLFPNDPPITPEGVERACQLALKLRACGEFQVVVSSPYLRCVQTALIIAEHLGTAVILDNELGEHLGPPVFSELAELPWRPLDRLASALLAWSPPGYSSLESRVEWRRVIGAPPQWVETQTHARRRYARRLLTFLRRSRQTQRNFVAVTHGPMIPACLRLLPVTSAWNVTSVGYCSAVIACLHSRAPSVEQVSHGTSAQRHRSRSMDAKYTDSSELESEGLHHDPNSQLHAAALRWWDVSTYGVEYDVDESQPQALSSSGRSRFLQELGPSWSQIERLLGGLSVTSLSCQEDVKADQETDCESTYTSPCNNTDASTEIFRNAQPSSGPHVFPTVGLGHGQEAFHENARMLEKKPLPQLDLRLGSALAKRRAKRAHTIGAIAIEASDNAGGLMTARETAE